MQEDCELLAGEADAPPRIRLRVRPSPGQWIRRAGEDVRQGAVVLARGERLTPASLGLAAGIGLDRLQVARRPRVALFSTGDELVMPGEVAPAQMKPGSIYNSNRFSACAAAPARLRGERPGHRARPAGRHAGRTAIGGADA